MSTTQQEQTRAAAPQEYLLEMRGITKAFAGVQALKGVDFYVRPGTVHALMGENGAGKSTLMKCLFGIYHKDEGTIKLRGQEVNFQSPHEALLNGISMVHQELEQVPERSVMENVWLGAFLFHFAFCRWAESIPHYRQVEYMTWPRAMAISETLWNETDSRNWDFFIQRVDRKSVV